MTTYTHTAGSPDYTTTTHTIRRASRTSWLILVDGNQVAEAKTYTEAKALAITALSQPELQPEQPTQPEPEQAEFKSEPATATPADTVESVHAEVVALASANVTDRNRGLVDAALQAGDYMAVAGILGHLEGLPDAEGEAVALAKRAAAVLEADQSTDSVIRRNLSGSTLDAYSAAMADPERVWMLVACLTDGSAFGAALIRCLAERMMHGQVTGRYEWPWWARLRLGVALGRRMPGLPAKEERGDVLDGEDIWRIAGMGDGWGLRGCVRAAFSSPEPELRVEVNGADLRAVVISARDDGTAAVWLDLVGDDGLTYAGRANGDGAWHHISGMAWAGDDMEWARDVLTRSARIAGAMLSTGRLVPP